MATPLSRPHSVAVIEPIKSMLSHGRPRFTLSTVALVAANLMPLAGALWLHWDAATIVLLFWAENLIIGAFQLLKLALLKTDHPIEQLGKLFAIPFFCVHFGGFCAVHGLFLVGLLKIGGGFEGVTPHAGGWGVGPLVFVELLVNVVAGVWNARPPGSEWAVLGLAASHGISFIENYVLKKEYAAGSLKEVMTQPYGRIVIMHLTIIAGAIPALMLGSPVGLLCVMILLKIFVDLRAHTKSHDRIRCQEPRPGETRAPGRPEIPLPAGPAHRE